ncbi:MAG: 50S ribosomal protein L2 [Candidatus Wildermuthbacteria bacterium RIFCSPHIGHO2_12_FULL_45_9]|uniref:Large ribosomal subunit protein uL2 n=1 Tax=Candidatus Wildermuthbacteria bacterium RIFCSPHIGHO2_02_FULL_45_25 TaxID=1802450 RepID=A0A1G2R508_9BACT|nr:MAG: 50S ribosomal protein L2 [Candidatus Wildermuthbacteria bacterium RIFCSPHIGHO2_01_FULL_45_20]OHA67916.1 MAG: 50S ribosomal protein L2 [Candidatus Wildermuthbacteria bacterium RIFCSPHIGHO2_02_FULL_45_25]OHA70580.1 MAG: 50S ribosomal protein L2 [Candidatus Wildermuthbacteria bacterium RIFCSPHIGHO2_12_FULL_45_9]
MKRGILTKKRPEKNLMVRIPTTAGRNNQGRITAWQRGGGTRKKYRLVEFGQKYLGKNGTVTAIEYDPNRNAWILLVEYEGGEMAYVLAPHDVKVGDVIRCDEKADAKKGNRMKLKNIPTGELVHNVEINPNAGGKMIRGAGTWAKIEAHEGKYTLVTLPSSEIRKVLSECYASIGMVSRPEFMYERVKNAGSARLKGKRPNVRGKAMNPVDHPHGGGEGRAPIGMKAPKTPWGKPARGVKTRRRKFTDKFIIQRRKKKKKK